MKIKKSPHLNKSIDDASLLFLNQKSGDEDVAYRNFYLALCDTSPHGELIRDAGFTLEEMVGISKNLRDFGFGLEKIVYLPIYAFYRLKTLKYILAHREELLGLKGKAIFQEAALDIKKYFNDIEFLFFYTGYYGYAPLGKSKR